MSAFPGNRVLIGETAGRTVADLMQWYGSPSKPEFELPMDQAVGFINKFDAKMFRQRIEEAETELGGNVPLLVFDNHDRPRMDARYGDGVHDTDIQRVLSTILFASGGATLMYYGDEIGMKTTPPTRIEDVKDTMEGIPGWPKNPGRDGERTPMQWRDGINAGFSTAKPWLPVPPSASAINVKAEEGDPNSLLAWYRSLIHLKKTNMALGTGHNVMLDRDNTKVLSWMRQVQGVTTVVVSVNFTPENQTVNLGAGEVGVKTTMVHTLLKSPGSSDPASINRIELGPFGVYIGEVR